MSHSDSPIPQALPRDIQRNRLVILAAYYGLFLYFLVNSFLATGFALVTPVIWLIQILPLLIFMRGLHQSRLRTYGWMSFVVLLYFTHGVLLAFDPQRRLLGIAEVGLCLLLFAYLILYIRAYRQHFQVPL